MKFKFTLLAMLLCSNLNGSAKSTDGGLEGWVLKPFHTGSYWKPVGYYPVAGSVVSIKPVQASLKSFLHWPLLETTDSSGEFLFQNIPNGMYNLSTGHQQRKVLVNNNKITRCEITTEGEPNPKSLQRPKSQSGLTEGRQNFYIDRWQEVVLEIKEDCPISVSHAELISDTSPISAYFSQPVFKAQFGDLFGPATKPFKLRASLSNKLPDKVVSVAYELKLQSEKNNELIALHWTGALLKSKPGDLAADLKYPETFPDVTGISVVDVKFENGKVWTR